MIQELRQSGLNRSSGCRELAAEWILFFSVQPVRKEGFVDEIPQREPFETAFRSSSSKRVMLAGAALVILVVAGVVAWRWMQSRPSASVAPVESAPTAAPAAPSAPTLPMAEGDALAKQLGM